MAYDDLELGADRGLAAAPRSVTAFFDTQEAADSASRDLVGAGVPSADIRVASGPASTAEPAHPHGFWETLKEFFVPDEDRHLYAEGLRRGGIALSVQTDSAAYDRVLEILDRDGAVDMEERSAGWRDEGWSAPGDAGSAGEREMAYAPAGSGTGGFGASRADQPLFEGPMDNAAIEPGQVVPTDSDRDVAAAVERPSAAAAPDTAYAAAAPGLPSAADTARDSTAMPGMLQPAPGPITPTRDLAHGRTRVRSYVAGPAGDGLPRE